MASRTPILGDEQRTEEEGRAVLLQEVVRVFETHPNGIEKASSKN